MERVLSRKHACLKETAAALDRMAAEASETKGETAAASSPSSPPEQVTRYELLKQVRRNRRVERYEAVMALHSQGASLRSH